MLMEFVILLSHEGEIGRCQLLYWTEWYMLWLCYALLCDQPAFNHRPLNSNLINRHQLNNHQITPVSATPASCKPRICIISAQRERKVNGVEDLAGKISQARPEDVEVK